MARPTFADRDLSLFDWHTQYQQHQCEEAYHKLVREGTSYDNVIWEKSDGICRITLNRPEKMNALNDALYHELLAGLGQASLDPEVRVIIIRGAGRVFCVGHDLSSPKGDESPPIDPKYNPTVRDFFQFERRRCGKYPDVMDLPKVTIAQVHGYCIGAGEAIQAACDFTIAAEDTQFGKRGFGRRTTGLNRWHNAWPIGSEKYRAGHMIPEISGKEAAEVGLINKAVPADQLEGEAERWAQALALYPAGVLGMAKETLNGLLDIVGWGTSMRNHYNWHLSLQYVRFRPGETSLYRVRRDEGLKGFLAHRAAHATPGRSH